MDINELTRKNLATLKLYLTHLPETLPGPCNPAPDLRYFAPKAGVSPADKAVHEALVDILGPPNSSSLHIRQRGPGIQALGDVLETHLLPFPFSMLLQQWLLTSIIAAERVYKDLRLNLPSTAPLSSSIGPSESRPSVGTVTLPSKNLGKSVSERPKPVRPQKHPTYNYPMMVQNQRLRRSVAEFSRTKPCLRARSYSLQKLPWLWPWITADMKLENALLRFQDAQASDNLLSEVPTSATTSRTTSEQELPDYTILSHFARNVDTWERDGVYRDCDRACIDLRLMGVEPEDSVELGAHEFAKIGLARLDDYLWLISFRIVDVLAWICGACNGPQPTTGLCRMRRQDGNVLSPLSDESGLRNRIGTSCINDWVGALSNIVAAAPVNLLYKVILSPAALARPSTFSWNDEPVKLPKRLQLEAALRQLLGSVADSLPSEIVKHDFISAHANVRIAAIALGLLLHDSESDNKGDGGKVANLAVYKDQLVAAQRQLYPNVPATSFMYPLTVSLFISPVFLFNKAHLAKNAPSLGEVLETWKVLGNVGRPAALIEVERNIWRLLFRVLSGADLTTCLLSFLEHWRSLDVENSPTLTDARTWFKPDRVIKRRAESGSTGVRNTKKPRVSERKIAPVSAKTPVSNPDRILSPLSDCSSLPPSPGGDTPSFDAFEDPIQADYASQPSPTPGLRGDIASFATNTQSGSSSSDICEGVKVLPAERDLARAELSMTQSRLDRCEKQLLELTSELNSVRAHAEKQSEESETTLKVYIARANSADQRACRLEVERDGLRQELVASENALTRQTNERTLAKTHQQRSLADRDALLDDLRDEVRLLKAKLTEQTDISTARDAQRQRLMLERDTLSQCLRRLQPGVNSEAFALPDPAELLHALECELTQLRESAAAANERAEVAEHERTVMETAHDRRATAMTILRQRVAELERFAWRY
ncbi:hypothetical protein PENSPDRAFT_752638 [Peniophora sp. CONT]|nr:hypothetical protein PENSPDRAFT_752638 [Peniophora sp. CONT]